MFDRSSVSSMRNGDPVINLKSFADRNYYENNVLNYHLARDRLKVLWVIWGRECYITSLDYSLCMHDSHRLWRHRSNFLIQSGEVFRVYKRLKSMKHLIKYWSNFVALAWNETLDHLLTQLNEIQWPSFRHHYQGCKYLTERRQKSIRTAAMWRNRELCTIQTEVAWKRLTSEWVSDASQRILFIAPPYHNTLFTISPF